MHNFLPDIYCFIDNLDKRYIKNLEKKIGIIYRNYDEKIDLKTLIKFSKLCKQSRRKLYIANEFKLAINANLDGVYIPSFNKGLNINSYNTKKNFVILGSAHNIKEIRIKENQKVKYIFISPLFFVPKSKKFLGINKFNLLTQLTNVKTIALGGINKMNIKKLNMLNCNGFASISLFKN